MSFKESIENTPLLQNALESGLKALGSMGERSRFSIAKKAIALFPSPTQPHDSAGEIQPIAT